MPHCGLTAAGRTVPFPILLGGAMPRKVSELNAIYPTDCAHLLSVRDRYAHWNYEIHTGYIRYHQCPTNAKTERRNGLFIVLECEGFERVEAQPVSA